MEAESFRGRGPCRVLMRPSLLEDLKRVVGAEHVSAGAIDAEVYSYDGSLATGAPGAIVFPRSTDEVAAVVRASTREGVPCVPRGFGTNLSGGSVAPRGGVVICLTRMNRVLAIHPERRTATVEAGVTNLELQNALVPLGFFFAPDPASQKAATLGGNAAENAGGPHCVKYGVTTNHILSMEVVLPSGEVARFGSSALDPPGYDLRGLITGSEGTLGIATELTLRILPLPEMVITCLAIYDSVADAARSVSHIIARGIVPATLEMMDAPVMRAVEESFPCGYPRDAAAVLIIEVEGPAAGLDAQARSIEEICAGEGCRSIRRARNAAERDGLWAGRRGAFGALARISPSFLVADCTVPRARLPEAVEAVAAIAGKYGFVHGNVFHAGDGNLHPLLFFDGRDPLQLPRVREAGREILQACVDLGGTITGEHGVGVEKLEAMRMVFSEDDLGFQLAVKRLFDPLDLLNPGKALPAAALPREPEGAGPRACPPAGSGEAWTPADAAEACEMVRAAFAGRGALLPVGGGRRADFGNFSARPAIPLRSQRLGGVIEHDAANGVVTLGAGVSLSAAQRVLAAGGQWLPFRPPLAEGCTLGGVAALGSCGPERLVYGAPRDRLLGLRFVSGTGRLIAAGGRVIKNVAGYDITRLLAGSAGTLGFLTELTFRTATIPEVCRALRAPGTLRGCAAAAGEILRSKLDPVWIAAVPSAPGLLLPQGTDDPGSTPWTLCVGFEGFEVTVGAQLGACASFLERAGMGEREVREFPVHEGVWAEAFRTLYGASFLLRADVPLDGTADLVAGAAGLLEGAQVLADFGCGRAWIAFPSLSGARWASLSGLAERAGGHVVLEKAPIEFKRDHEVFAPARPEWKLLHRLKAALDPRGIFAPGRLPGKS